MRLTVIFLIALMLFSLGCTTQVEETEEQQDYEMQKLEVTSGNKEVFYSIRLTEYGPEPDTIEVNVGDTLKLEVVNDIQGLEEYYDTETMVEEHVIPSPDPDLQEDEVVYEEYEVTTTQTREEGMDVRFIIYEYKVDELLEKGGVVDIEIVVDQAGTFAFGDDTETIPKGRLTVN